MFIDNINLQEKGQISGLAKNLELNNQINYALDDTYLIITQHMIQLSSYLLLFLFKSSLLLHHCQSHSEYL